MFKLPLKYILSKFFFFPIKITSKYYIERHFFRGGREGGRKGRGEGRGQFLNIYIIQGISFKKSFKVITLLYTNKIKACDR